MCAPSHDLRDKYFIISLGMYPVSILSMLKANVIAKQITRFSVASCAAASVVFALFRVLYLQAEADLTEREIKSRFED